jgi:hypothetical protein
MRKRRSTPHRSLLRCDDAKPYDAPMDLYREPTELDAVNPSVPEPADQAPPNHSHPPKARREEEKPEGSGERSALVDPHHSRRDLRMIRRAIKQGWVTDERAMRILDEMQAICCDEPTAKVRDKIAAARVVMAAAAIDAKRESTKQKAEPASDDLEIKRQFAALALAEIQRLRREQAKTVQVIDPKPTSAD